MSEPIILNIMYYIWLSKNICHQYFNEHLDLKHVLTLLIFTQLLSIFTDEEEETDTERLSNLNKATQLRQSKDQTVDGPAPLLSKWP